jgi:hypothetical protein
VSWLSRLFGRPKAPVAVDPHDDATCSLCGKHRRGVKKLIEGRGTYICDACVVLCVEILEDEERKRGGSFHVELVLATLQGGGPRLAHRTATPLLRAAILLAGDDRTALRRIYLAAARVDDAASALAAVLAIPIERRAIADRLNHVAYLLHSERAADAVAAVAAIDAATLAGDDVLVHTLHRAYAELESGATTPDLARQHQRELGDGLRARVDELDGAIQRERLAVLTLAHLTLAEHDDAERRARAMIERDQDDALAHELLARVLAARGDDAGAGTARNDARRLAHPDGALGRKLARIAGPFRD